MAFSLFQTFSGCEDHIAKRHRLVRGEGSPPQGVLRFGLAASAAVLGQTPQALDCRSRPPWQTGPVDHVECVLDQQPKFGVAFDREAAGEGIGKSTRRRCRNGLAARRNPVLEPAPNRA